MVRRLASWLAANRRAVVATELEFAAEVGRARLGGRVDRIELDADGRAVVVDLKTGTSKVPAAELPEHGQLAAYQVAVEAGAFDGVSESGGAELVQVGKARRARTSRSSRRRRWPATTTPAGPARWCSRWRRGWPARPSGRSRTATARMCPVRTSCPVQDDGRAVTG